MRATWTQGMRLRSLSVMLIISAAMIICIILAHWRGARETELENQRYREEHSLFEDIVVGGRLMQETFLRRDEEGNGSSTQPGIFQDGHISISRNFRH